jgi:hypothetical protein
LRGYRINPFGYGIFKNTNVKISEQKEIAVLIHIIGLPEKNGTDKPLYDYQKIIFDSLVTSNGNFSLKPPNAPDGLFERIEKEVENVCLYKRISLNILTALTKYTLQER